MRRTVAIPRGLSEQALRSILMSLPTGARLELVQADGSRMQVGRAVDRAALRWLTQNVTPQAGSRLELVLAPAPNC